MALGLTFAFDASKETPQDVARRRAIAEAIMGRSMSPRNVGEGFGAIANGIVANVQNRRAQAGEQAGRAGADDVFGRIMSGLTGQPYSGQPSPSFAQNATPLDPASARVAQAHSGGGLPSSFLSAVDRTEGAGAYDTLFGHAQRQGGPFAGTDVSQMSIGDALAFAAPSGAYGQHVKGKVGRVATPMGRHQIVGSTLRSAVQEMGLDPSMPFDPQTQDMIAGHLARRRIAGATTMDGKVSALRSEWEGLKNVPYSQMVQIVNDLESSPVGATMNAPASDVAAVNAFAQQRGPQMMEEVGIDPSTVPTSLPSMDVPVQDPQMAMAAQQQMSMPQQPGMQPPQAQQPVQMAQAGGLDLQTLMEAAANPFLNEGQRAVVNSLLQQQLQQQDPMRQLDMDYKRAQIDKMGREASGQAELGLNPQYGVDANGNPVLIQIGKDGKAVQTALPEGVQLSKEPIRLDAGTHFVLLDPITRQPVGQIPKENREAARETAIGKIEGETLGEAQVNLGSTLQKADQSIGLINQMLEHPGLSTATGLSSTLDPRNYIAGTDATNFNVMRKQLEGQAFLEAFESLKGGGAITEIEGVKATEAIARLNTAQSEEAYRSALNELKSILETGKTRAMERAGEGAGWQSMGGVRIRRKQ